MDQYVALDVSLREISVCVIDSKGTVAFEGQRHPSRPQAMASRKCLTHNTAALS